MTNKELDLTDAQILRKKAEERLKEEQKETRIKGCVAATSPLSS